MQRKAGFSRVRWATPFSPKLKHGESCVRIFWRQLHCILKMAQPAPGLAQMHYVRDELIPFEAA